MQNSKEKPQIKLPFSPQKVDVGEWAYDHRFGLMFTFIMGVIFVLLTIYVTITVQNTTHYNSILVEMEPEIHEEELTQEQTPKSEPLEYEQVSNLTSNENADQLNDQLKDYQNTPAKEIYKEIEAMEQRAMLNKQLYEQGLAREAQLQVVTQPPEIEEVTAKNVKIDGMVTVSFSFSNPVRRSVNLTVPAYMCEGGGMVVIDAVMDNNGRILDASINKKTTTKDNCMIQTAINSAKQSRFNLDASAPTKHSGTITYIFIPQ